MNIKKGILVLAFVVFIIAFLPGCEKKTQSANLQQTSEDLSKTYKFATSVYSDPQTTLKCNYPQGWDLKEGYMNSKVFFLSPKESEKDIFQENFNIMAQDFGGKSYSLNAYDNITINQIMQIIPNAKIEGISETTILGLPATKVIYIGKQSNVDLKWEQIWTIKDKSAWIFTYTAQPAQFDKYLPTIDEMMASVSL